MCSIERASGKNSQDLALDIFSVGDAHFGIGVSLHKLTIHKQTCILFLDMIQKGNS